MHDQTRLESLLREWLDTPFFESKQDWEQWATEFRRRVESALHKQESPGRLEDDRNA